MLTKRTNFIDKNVQFYQNLIDQTGGGDFRCVYFPDVYKGICTFILRITLEKYFESNDLLDFAISEVGKTHYSLEEENLNEMERFKRIFQSIDKILIEAGQARSNINRLMGVELIFPDHYDLLIEWLKNNPPDEEKH